MKIASIRTKQKLKVALFLTLRTQLVQSVVRVRAFDALRPWSRSHGSGFVWDTHGRIAARTQHFSFVTLQTSVVPSIAGAHASVVLKTGCLAGCCDLQQLSRSQTSTSSTGHPLFPCILLMACNAEPNLRRAEAP